MTNTPRPWYRSPALWFFLPGLVFLVWGWVFSMQRVVNLDFEAGGYSVRVQNDRSAIGAGWQETRVPLPSSFRSKGFHLKVIPRPSWASTGWFPLPSYAVNRLWSLHFHNLVIPYWLLLLVYAGLWQLPWLARYHRQRRIERSLAMAPADP